MYRNIYTHISDSLEDRASDILTNIATNHKEYIKLTNEIILLQQQILKFLPEDMEDIFFRYEAIWSERDDIKELLLYKQGIIDGIKIGDLVMGATKNLIFK